MDMLFANYVMVIGISVASMIRVSMPAFPILCTCMYGRVYTHTHTHTHTHHLVVYRFEDDLHQLGTLLPNFAV